jgi:hypothetical protein
MTWDAAGVSWQRRTPNRSRRCRSSS